jgi:hypothetical protein
VQDYVVLVAPAAAVVVYLACPKDISGTCAFGNFLGAI